MRGLPRRVLLMLTAGGILLGLASPAWAGAPPAPDEPVIRVLLQRGAERVEVDGHLRRHPGRFSGPGPHEVEGRPYRGAIAIARFARGLAVVNEVPLEDYVAGTVAGEVPASWGQAVLRAQAIAIRTYALHRRDEAGARGWDLEAGTEGQLYLGAIGETPAGDAAVAATQGQVLTWDGTPILACFHSAAGGRTASAEEVWGHPVPYLVSVAVPGEFDSPDTYWRASVGRDELAAALAEDAHPIGAVRDVLVRARSASGRVAALQVRGSRGGADLTGEELRRLLGVERIRSTLFDVRPAGDALVFVGSGRGHGVGMSQWGARALARRGADARAILARFYPGARLERIPSRAAWRESAAAVAAVSAVPVSGVSP